MAVPSAHSPNHPTGPSITSLATRPSTCTSRARRPEPRGLDPRRDIREAIRPRPRPRASLGGRTAGLLGTRYYVADAHEIVGMTTSVNPVEINELGEAVMSTLPRFAPGTVSVV